MISLAVEPYQASRALKSDQMLGAGKTRSEAGWWPAAATTLSERRRRWALFSALLEPGVDQAAHATDEAS